MRERRDSAKLVAERDREGHIEYKLKLIDPSPERFERLVHADDVEVEAGPE